MRKTMDIWQNPSALDIGRSIKEFLYNLNGPTWIDITGQDTNRTRVLVTLLHGNEPSGVKAIFHWLNDPDREKPLTNLSIFICSVEAALTVPEFSHRYLAGAPDMNRCFHAPYVGDNGKLAERVLQHIRRLKPEAVIDIHNTSGSGPNFAVTSRLENNFIKLGNIFSKRLILTGLKLGALMEADVGCPIITLECGGSFDLESDQTAQKALGLISSVDDLFKDDDKSLPEIFKHPLRFEIKYGVSIAFAKSGMSNIDVTLAADIERHNFGITPPNELLGWLGPKGLNYFTAIDDRGIDIKDDLFVVRDNKLYTAQSLRLFMVTPRPEIAQKDCLFYLVKTDE